MTWKEQPQMKRTRLFKGQTAVVYLFSTVLVAVSIFAEFTFSVTAEAQTQSTSLPSSDPYQAFTQCLKEGKGMEACKPILDALGVQSNQERKCEDLDKQFVEEMKNYRKGCGNVASCVDKIVACEEAEANMSTTQMLADSFNLGSCNDLSNTECPEKNAGTAEDFKTEKDRLQERADDRQKEVRDLISDNQKKSFEDQKNLIELKREGERAAQKMRDQQNEIMDQIQQKIEATTRSKMETYRAARAAYNEIDNKYIQARDAAREAANNVIKAQYNLETMCRQYAENKYNEAERDRNLRIAQQAKLGKKNLGSVAGAAGQVKREIKYRNKQRSLNYAGYFNDCKNGVSAGGSASITKIAEVQLDKQRRDANLVDLAANLEKQRLQVISDVKEQESTLNQQQQTLIQSLQQKLNTNNQDYIKLQQDNQQDYQMAVQQIQQQQQTMQGQVGLANSQLMQTNNELMMANLRHTCALSTGGSIRSAVGDKKLEQLETSSAALSALAQICTRAQVFACPNFMEGTAAQNNQGGRDPSSTQQQRDSKTAQRNVNGCNVYIENNRKLDGSLNDASFTR